MTEAKFFDLDPWFIYHCLRTYWGKTWPLFLLACAGMAAVLLLLVFRLVKTDGKVFFRDEITWGAFVFLLAWFLVLAVLLINPVSVKVLIPRVMEPVIFYRVFWMLPVVPLCALAASVLTFLSNRSGVRILVFLLVFGTVIAVFPVNSRLRKGIKIPENIYKVPDEVVFACEEIHKDFGEDAQPKTIWAFELEQYVRQYDPYMRLTIPRNLRLVYSGSQTVGERKISKKYNRRVAILNAINDAEEVSVETFQKAMKKTKTDYLIIPSDYTSHEFLKEAGCYVIASNEDVAVYRYDWGKDG